MDRLKDLTKSRLFYERCQERSASSSKTRGSVSFDAVDEQLRKFELRQLQAKRRAEEFELAKARTALADHERAMQAEALRKEIMQRQSAEKLDKMIKKYKRIGARHHVIAEQEARRSAMFHERHLKSVDETKRRLEFVLSKEEELKRRTEEKLENQLLSSRSILVRRKIPRACRRQRARNSQEKAWRTCGGSRTTSSAGVSS